MTRKRNDADDLAGKLQKAAGRAHRFLWTGVKPWPSLQAWFVGLDDGKV